VRGEQEADNHSVEVVFFDRLLDLFLRVLGASVEVFIGEDNVAQRGGVFFYPRTSTTPPILLPHRQTKTPSGELLFGPPSAPGIPLRVTIVPRTSDRISEAAARRSAAWATVSEYPSAPGRPRKHTLPAGR